jgi:hypothetical protein
MDIKLLFSLAATGAIVIAFFFYIQDIFRGKTQPHIYTWLIWAITQGTAVAGLWYGGGGVGAWSLTLGTVLIFLVLLLCIKRGTKNITRSDTITLGAALCAIGIWVFLDVPLLAIGLVSAIDVSGYIPSIRKSFEEPWSENIPAWIWFIASGFLAIAALEKYDFLTLTYLVAINTANILLVVVCIVRRSKVPPKINQ